MKDIEARKRKTAQGTPRGKPPENTNSITNSNPVETRDTKEALDKARLSIYNSVTTST
jgi:hypothetical protein